MKKNIAKIILNVIVFLFILAPTALAQLAIPTPMERLRDTANSANLSTVNVSPQNIVVSVILVLFGLLGLIFVILIIYAGFTWMTSQGEKEKISKAKETITNSVIGIIIIIISYSIVVFINDVIIRNITRNIFE